jgi:hypothetical protein
MELGQKAKGTSCLQYPQEKGCCWGTGFYSYLNNSKNNSWLFFILIIWILTLIKRTGKRVGQRGKSQGIYNPYDGFRGKRKMWTASVISLI